jgi:hypothetical protein
VIALQTLPDWLPWLTGVEAEKIPADAKIEFGFTNMPQSWGVFVLIGIVVVGAVAIVALYRREIDTCPPFVKTILSIARVLVLLVLVGVYLGPALKYSTTRTREPFVALMRDASQSMNTPDAYQDEQDAARAAAALGLSVSQVQAQKPTRVQIVNELLHKENDRLLRELQGRGKVRIADFGDSVKVLETLPARRDGEKDAISGAEAAALAVTRLVAEGRSTDISAPIKEGLSLNPLAAIILFTEGQNTSQDNPLEAAKDAKAKGTPLFIVGVGDPGRPRNLKVANLYVSNQAWPDEPFEIEAIVNSDSVEPRDVRLDLIQQRAAEGDGELGPDSVVQSQQVTLPIGGGNVVAKFNHAVKEPGRYVYSVRIETIENELKEDDNRLASSPVRVLNREHMRVLLVAGAPTWEYRLVQKLLGREKRTVELSCWLQTLDEERAQEGTRVITKLPITQQDLFYYDVVLLFDPNPQEFDEPWIELLKKFASEHSGGVLYMAGPKYSARFLTGTRTNKLRDILPVRFGDLGATEVASLLSTNKQAWPLRIMSQHADHPVMSFYPDRQENLARWEGLPGIYWSFPALDAKPTTAVLVEHSDPTLRRVEGPRPLLVTGRYGAGNTVYIGFNGTWRWRQAGRNAEFFDKFWIQTTRYLVEGRSLEGQRRGSLQADHDRYEIGDRVTITARLQDPTYQPLVVPQIEATLESAGNAPQTVILRPVANQIGQYEAILTARHTGVNTLRVAIPGSEGGEELRFNAPFTVELPKVETKQVWLNKPLLRDLAASSGGAYFEVDELDKLAAAIPDATETIEVPGKPIALWSTWLVMVFLVSVLGFEWAVRKAFKLL